MCGSGHDSPTEPALLLPAASHSRQSWGQAQGPAWPCPWSTAHRMLSCPQSMCGSQPHYTRQKTAGDRLSPLVTKWPAENQSLRLSAAPGPVHLTCCLHGTWASAPHPPSQTPAGLCSRESCSQGPGQTPAPRRCPDEHVCRPPHRAPRQTWLLVRTPEVAQAYRGQATEQQGTAELPRAGRGAELSAQAGPGMLGPPAGRSARQRRTAGRWAGRSAHGHAGRGWRPFWGERSREHWLEFHVVGTETERPSQPLQGGDGTRGSSEGPGWGQCGVKGEWTVAVGHTKVALKAHLAHSTATRTSLSP